MWSWFRFGLSEVVGAVYDGRDSKGLAKWMEGVVGGMAIVERVVWFIKRVGWLA